ncbi:MAG: peroxidase-related enzyme [Candidatus Lokiarchaeota archaeon]|nr:peroxidase-related enzyme [Candidatus Lokiarchaeota archaeon]
MPRIRIIEHENADKELKEVYDKVIQKRGKLAEIYKIHSLNPPSLLDHMNLYLTIMFAKSPLSRAQREMIAVVVSEANKCVYCQQHHGEALNYFWKDQERVKLLQEDYTQVDLSPKDKLLCDLGYTMTLFPASVEVGVIINQLKELETTDREILDVTLVIAYFNFVNRLVLGLNVETEEEIGGYKYD